MYISVDLAWHDVALSLSLSAFSNPLGSRNLRQSRAVKCLHSDEHITRLRGWHGHGGRLGLSSTSTGWFQNEGPFSKARSQRDTTQKGVGDDWWWEGFWMCLKGRIPAVELSPLRDHWNRSTAFPKAIVHFHVSELEYMFQHLPISPYQHMPFCRSLVVL